MVSEDIRKEMYKNEKLIPEASKWFLVGLIEYEGRGSGLTYAEIRESLWNKVQKLFKSKEDFDFTFGGFTTKSLLDLLLYQDIIEETSSSDKKYQVTDYGKKLLNDKKDLIREYIGNIEEL